MRKTTKAILYTKFLIAFVGLMSVSQNSFGQCPTVTMPSQSFCDINVPKVSDLVATDNGGGIRWYASETSTTPLASTVGLVNGRDYFADDNSGTCGTRQRVNVVIYGVPFALSFQGVCVDHPEEATIADLYAVGNDIHWYNVSSGGSPLDPTTILMDDTVYYVNQSNPDTGCRTSRFSVYVNVGVVPVPTGDPYQIFCGDSQPTVADIAATGNNHWYSTLSSGSPLPLSTPLVSGETYYGTTFDLPCESVERLQVTVEVVAPNDAGSNGEMEICESGLTSTNTVNLFDALLGTPDTNGTWVGPLPTSNGNTGTVNVTTMSSAGSPYIFTYAVSSVDCPTSTATVRIIIIEGPNPGTNGSLTLCINSAPQNLFDSLQGTPEPGGVWSPALSSGTGEFDPTKDAPGTYTYTLQGVPPCGDVTATVNVTVNPEPEPGTNGSLTLCLNDVPTNLFNSLGGSAQSGGTWTPALASGTGFFDPARDAAGTYTYSVTGISPCGIASATVTVTTIPPPDPGTNGNVVLCSNDASVNLFDSLGGTPQTGGVWSPALASGSGVFDPTIDAAGVYTYTLQGTAPCGPVSSIVNVTVNPEAEPGIHGSLTLCIDSPPERLINSLGGTPQSGGTWTPALASGTDLFDPSKDAAGVYTYNVSGISPCGDATSTVTVTIATVPQAGSIGRLAICTNDAPVNLFEHLGGEPDSGGTWSPALASGTGFFNPAEDAAGPYTYTVTTACGSDSALVVVALIQQPNITGLTLRADTICLNDAIDVNLSGATQLADGNYSLNYSLTGANASEHTITVTIANGGTVITVPESQLSIVGTTTFTILNLLDPVTNCGTASGTLPKVDFNIEQAPTPQLANGGDTFCIDDAATIANLTGNIANANNITWYDAVENGNAYPEDTPLIDGNIYYASNSSDNGCGTGVRLAVTVSIDDCVPLELIFPDGFSPNGDTINDEFLIKNLRELYPNFKLQIYNRYGNILYKGDGNTPNWDGTSNQGRGVGNGTLPVGVYFYILELKDTNNKTIQGRVYLSR